MAVEKDAINSDILDLAVRMAIGAKSDGADWIDNPKGVAEFIEVIARKLHELSQWKS